MSSLDYSRVIDILPQASPAELLDLLRMASEPLGAREVCLYLADFQGIALQPLFDAPQPIEAEEVATTMAGRVFRTGDLAVAEREGGTRVWVPLLERGERTGVVALTVAEPSDDLLGECVRLGRFAGLLVRSFARTTDLFHLHRRRQPMTLAAGMQWDLLPPLTVRSARALVCGRLEPAYRIAGDAFDYAMNAEYLEAGLFDGMGHGTHSTLMTALAVGAYRHARRSAAPLPAVYTDMDQAVASQYDGEGFVTAVFARLRLETGTLEWVAAGHPAPLLLRAHGVRQLSCAPSLPLGLGGTCQEVASEQLEPGDCLLFYTDGTVEARSPSGDEFGVERLGERWGHLAASGLEADEILRRLVEEVLVHNAHRLRDDASLMLMRWAGANATD